MMSSEWQNFLDNAGAVIHNGRVAHFGNPELELQAAVAGEIITDLSHRALITVNGVDAEKFLQGQLTNDILAISETRSQLSAQCNPKGRVQAVLRVFRRKGKIYLALPESLLNPVLARLRKYVLMSKVTLEPELNLTQVAYAGTRILQQPSALLSPLPDAVNAACLVGNITVIRIPGPHHRFEMIGPAGELEGLWTRLSTHAAPVGADSWELLDILGGIPVIYPSTVDAFVPQMLNLDIVDAVSFKKGCYTGQEIVARTHYLGKIKRRMYLLSYHGFAVPEPGTTIFSSAHRGDESVGAVVAAQTAPQGDVALLAVLQSEIVGQGELRLGKIGGPCCSLLPSPYPLQENAG